MILLACTYSVLACRFQKAATFMKKCFRVNASYYTDSSQENHKTLWLAKENGEKKEEIFFNKQMHHISMTISILENIICIFF